MSSNFGWGDHPRELTQDEIKFDIYLRTREIKQLGRVLRGILILPPERRDQWLKENGDIMSESLDSFIDESNFALRGITLDDEMVELSSDLITSLRDTLTVMQSVMRNSQEIAG